MVLIRLLAAVAGIYLIGSTFLSAMRTFVLPRSDPVILSSIVFRGMRRVFEQILRYGSDTFERRDRIMALFAPVALLSLPPVWLFVSAVGYALIYWAMGIDPMRAFVFSGSSILTLGFATADNLWQILIAFTEAIVGLMLVAMLISYLPTMYSAFQRREKAVSLLEVRAGTPPTAPEMVWRLHGLTKAEALDGYWQGWEEWFTELDESHTSLAALVFFRSPTPGQSWVNAAAAVLDTAALFQSVLDGPLSVYPTLTIRAGNLALHHIAEFFRIPYNRDPHFPENPIAITREEFDAAWDRLQAQGVKLRADRDLAWVNFAGWRVNYDDVLSALSKLTMSPEVQWLSDHTFVPADHASGRSGGTLRKVAE